MSDTEEDQKLTEDDELEMLRAKAEERRMRKEEEEKKIEEDKARMQAEKAAKDEEERKRREEATEKKKTAEAEKHNAEKKKLEAEIANMGEAGGSKLGNVLRAKEDMQKSPEQLQAEKREIIAQRLVGLELDGQNKEDLIAQAHKFYECLVSVHSQIYDLTEKHDRQRYDMMELAERARQIEKGKAKTRRVNIVHTGLGGSVFPWIQDQCAQAPQKISLFSRYERVTDRRTFKDRRDLWQVVPDKKKFVPEKPKAKLKKLEDANLGAANKKKARVIDENEEEGEEGQEDAPVKEMEEEALPVKKEEEAPAEEEPPVAEEETEPEQEE